MIEFKVDERIQLISKSLPASKSFPIQQTIIHASNCVPF